MKYMGQELCISIDDVDESSLISLIDRAVALKKDDLIGAVEKLRETEKKNIKVAAKLLK